MPRSYSPVTIRVSREFEAGTTQEQARRAARAKELFNSFRGQWWKKHGLQYGKTKTQTQQSSSSSGIYSARMNCTKIHIRILDIWSILSKYITQPYLMKQPHTIQKVILVKVSASGKKRKCKWLQMRSICCQSTRVRVSFITCSRRELAQHEKETWFHNYGAYTQEYCLFSSSYIAATKINANMAFHVKWLALSKGPNNIRGPQIKNQSILFI